MSDPTHDAWLARIDHEVSQAEGLLASADVQGLRNLLEESHKRERNLLSVMDTLVHMYAEKPITRMPDDPTAIEAIRDVALAAIKLAGERKP